VSAEASARAIDAFAGLLASSIALEGARRRAEDDRARMASLVDAGLALGRELALDDLLSQIVQSARTVLGARYAALGVLDATGTELAQFVTAGMTEEERDAIGPLPRGKGILGVLIRDARPLRLERLSDDPRSAGFPPNHPPMTSFLGVPVALRGEAFGNLYLTDKAGGAPFTEEDEQLAMTLAAQAAVAVDNVRRYEAERLRADEIESVLEVGRAVLSTLDIDALLPLVARRARRLTGAETVGVAVRDGDELVFRYAHGIDALGMEGSRGPLQSEALAALLRTALGAPEVQVCELAVDGVTAGALVAVGWRPFDEGARRLLETFSSQVAVAVVNARAVAGERESLLQAAQREAAKIRERAQADSVRRAVEAQEAERARVARELHDESGQVLTALAVHLRALESDVGPGEIQDRIAEMRRSLAEASVGLRELTTRLRPTAIDEHGLSDAIEEQAARLRRTGVTVEVELRGLEPPLPEEVQTVIFRVAQESLTNVARHSEATHASVVVSVHEGRVRLVVEDDGRGFDPSAPTARFGLAGIRERIEMLGGHLRIESSPGAGTAVVVDLEIA
jgi:signal transduction histidine kinase